VASRRKLTIPQLVTLCEVYWDDTAKLAEILEDLRQRFEPEAAALYRSVAGRIDLLRRDPEAAKLQPPPTQRAEAADAEPVAPPPRLAAPRRRAVVIAIATAATAAAVWFLWPHKAPPPAPTTAAVGPEIALNGRRPEPPPKAQAVPPSASSATSSPGLSDEPPSLQSPSRDGGGGAARDAAEGSAPPSRPSHSTPPRVTEKKTADVEDAAERAAADDAGVVAAEAADRSAPVAAAKSATPARGRSGARPGAAEAGIAIDDATLTCYRTDDNPDGCNSPPGGGGAAPSASAPAIEPPLPPAPPPPPAAAPGAAAGSSPAAAPSPAASSSSARPEGVPVSTGSPEGGGAPPAGGGGGGSGSGAGGGGSSEHSAAASEAKPSKSSEIKDKTKPEKSPAARDAEATAPAAAPPACPPAPAIGRVVFILDGSLSMGLPLDVDAHLEDRLDDGVRRHDPVARQEYRALLATPGPKRITRARTAFAAAAAGLPRKVELGLVVFQECRDIRKIGVFDAAHRVRAIDYVRRVVPRGRTPIADSLRRAAEMLGKGRSSIVLLTDGREFCGGDPCAAARAIKAAHPHTPVSIVDITGQAKAECVAEITGGRSYKPEAADDLARVVSAAFRNADPHCDAASPVDAKTTARETPPLSPAGKVPVAAPSARD
jgi:hypothetical protein